MNKKVSLKDIALKAGVSVTLVSYVLNNQQVNRINKDTAKKIREAAKSLNYQPNVFARSLKTNRSNTIGLIVADIANPFFSQFARIIEDEADKNNYTVIFGSSDEDVQKFRKLIDSFLKRQVDGLIIAPPENSETQIRYLKKQGIPFLLFDRYFPSLKTNYVVLDNFRAAYNAVSHLIDSGRKRIGMIGFETSLIHLQERNQGYLSALKDGKIQFKKRWLKEINTPADKMEVQSAVMDLLSMKEPADAILFASNTIAALGLKYINSTDINVPKELSLISFDETDALDLFYAPLTYLKQPLQEMGHAATMGLVETINGNNKKLQIQMNAELVIRQSTLQT